MVETLDLVVEVLGRNLDCDTAEHEDDSTRVLDHCRKQLREVFECYQGTKHLSVLLTGKTGTGKTTLVNGILGVEVAKSSVGVQGAGATSGVQEYCQVSKGVELTVWDSPGLQDGTQNEAEYLEMIAKQCSQRDVVMYCISMVHPRFVRDNMDVRAMVKLTEKFGEEFWSNCVIVLTFANAAADIYLKYEAEAKKEEKFQQLVAEWDHLIRGALREEVRVSEDTVNNIAIVPAGHPYERSLPDRPYWLTSVWMECLDAIPTVKSKTSLLLLSSERSRQPHQVTEEDFQGKKLHKHPLVFLPGGGTVQHKFRNNTLVVECMTCVAGGSMAGAALGSGLGLAAGGVGIIVGFPLGLVVGVVTGSISAVVVYKKATKKATKKLTKKLK